MKKLSCCLISLMLLPGATFAASEISLGLSDHSLTFSVGQSGPDGQQAWVAAQFTDEKHDLRQAEVGLAVTDRTSDQVTFGAGLVTVVQNFETSGKDIDGIALAVQLRGDADLPLQFPLKAYASIDYAPSITSFQDIDSYRAVRTGVKYPFLSNGDIGLSYHKLSSKLDASGDKTTPDEGVLLELSLKF